MKILLSSNPQNLEAALQGLKSVTVEAEFGSVVVRGSLETRAHHVPQYAHLPSPCTYPNVPVPELEAIGLSHVDLDSVGGTLAALGQKPGPDSFWQLAGQVDIKGPHRLADAVFASNATDQDILALQAFWAWSEANRYFAPRDGSVADASEFIGQARGILLDIFGELAGKPEGGSLIQAGRDLKAREEQLNKDTFLDEYRGVLIRRSEKFVNHLYATPKGKAGRAVVAYNPEKGSVTISLAEPVPGLSCRTLVQELWGPEAGGHDGIAGSPRDQQLSEAEAKNAAWVLIRRLSQAAEAV